MYSSGDTPVEAGDKPGEPVESGNQLNVEMLEYFFDSGQISRMSR